MNDFEDDDFMDKEAANWEAQKAQALARRSAAHANLPLPQNMTVGEHDRLRREQALKDQAAVRAAAITPGALTGGGNDPFNIDTKVSIPSSDSSVVPITPSSDGSPQPATNELTFWVCKADLPECEVFYAASWEDLKTRLVNHPGTYTATEHKVANNSAALLGFFVPAQYVFPKTQTKVFEVIVQNGKIFKAES